MTNPRVKVKILLISREEMEMVLREESSNLLINIKVSRKNTFKDKQPTIRTKYKQPMRTVEYKDNTFNKKSEEIKREPLQCWGCGGVISIGIVLIKRIIRIFT